MKGRSNEKGRENVTLCGKDRRAKVCWSFSVQGDRASILYGKEGASTERDWNMKGRMGDSWGGMTGKQHKWRGGEGQGRVERRRRC